MNAVYIVEQGAVVRQSSRHLVVTKGKQKIMTLPLIQTERLLLFGNVQLTTQAVNTLLQEGVDVSFLSRTGKLRGKLVSPESKNMLLRLAQYERYLDDQFQLQLARSIVRGKLTNARYVIQRYRRSYPESDFQSELEVIEHQLQKAEKAKTVNSLMGVEGLATAVYFKAFGRMFRKEFAFEKRTRRPPKDPVNAILSLGYTFITNEIFSLLGAHGFDPYIGYLHGVVYGRPSLALDIVEEFRHPLVDRLTLNLFNNQILKKEDFRNQQGEGVYLNDEGFKKFIKHYETRMREPFTMKPSDEKTTFRQIMQRQIQKMNKAIKNGINYEPFSMGD